MAPPRDPRSLVPLPIDGLLPGVMESLEKHPALVLEASPGTGKTTRVPPALLRARFRHADQEILVLEPRRLAAKWAARRVAEELGEEVGRTVGYHFRFENVGSVATRLRFLTEGMLMRRILSDPSLRRVAAVVLDEFHERHLQGDSALAFLRHLQKTSRPELRILVMSATLETAKLAEFLGGCPVQRIEARLHPVELRYLPEPPARSLEFTVRDAVLSLDTAGDVLVFLPGMAEIRKSAEALSGVAGSRGIQIHALHGDLTREEQDRAIQKGDRRKVILSTNIAETSLTIEGITAVVDSGLHRQASYSWWSGMPALHTRPISRASAIQRAGRAGRTGPGQCLRLYTRGDFDSRAPFEIPEIRRADLSETVLQLKALGIRNLAEFPWFEAPSDQSLEGAIDLLRKLGALDGAGSASSLTPLGTALSRISAHPRLARMLLEARRLGCISEGLTLAAWIAEGELDSLDAFEMLRRPMFERVRKIRSQLEGSLSNAPWLQAQGGSTGTQKENVSGALAKAILAGFPDHVARKRKIGTGAARGRDNEVELLFSSGGSSRIEESGVIAFHEYFAVLDAQERKFQNQLRAEVKVRSVVAIEPDWLLDLEPSGVREEESFFWDEARQQVLHSSRMTYGELTLDESQSRPFGDPSVTAQEETVQAVSAVLLKSVFGVELQKAFSLSLRDWIEVLGRIADREALEYAFSRILQYGKLAGKSELKRFETGEGVFEIVERIVAGKTRAAELREIQWPDSLIQEISFACDLAGLASELDRSLPLSFALPSGRKLKIHYPLGQSPWAESRLQDFFGMKAGPTLLNGRIQLTLHLLAPNQRAVQVTSDLAGFWQRGYSEVRNELRRRYPKHAWPEDPVHAQPPLPRGTR